MTSSADRQWPVAVRALQHANFRLYFAGQAVSILGSWIQQVALSWLIYRLTGSVALLGVTTFAALLPQLIVGPLAGAWTDRHDKRRLLIAVQGILAVQALVLAGLTAFELIGPALIVAMSLLLGVLNAFDTPLRQSLIGSFVGRREDLPNALALNAMLFNAGRFVGPPLAGVLLALTSEALCFALNGLSFLALLIGLLLIRIDTPARASGSTGKVFREGLDYVWQNQPIRLLILTLAMVNLTASSYAVLLPVFARDIFGGDAQTLGWLWGAAGCGAFLSTLFLATRQALPGLVRIVLVGALLSAAALLAFAASPVVPLALAAMALLGFGISVGNVGINMLLQSLAPEQLRGRVVSFFTSTRFGFDAIGGLLAGLLAARIGAPLTLALEGAVLLLFCFWLLARRQTLREQVRDDLHSQAGG
ncbi:MFS transporter [Geopseudomonas guangdongensis]|uniref:Predicted arabinose efflux permease, MFS family n=1 Tax=Geopseudomonas guangdongensis TaxID=1245526 RepID=A0A1H2ECM4_9GAMM|nr:MFS transporter [Pseudomonas guangdongensis]SDT92896.1 Predicted arabinose efflux permease, MFS family [Pseudomonas guangdongensis]